MRRLLVALLVIGILGSGVVYAQRGPATVIEEDVYKRQEVKAH